MADKNIKDFPLVNNANISTGADSILVVTNAGELKKLNGQIVTIDSAGEFGVGTTNPAEQIHALKNQAGNTYIKIENTNTTTNSSAGLFIQGGGNNAILRVRPNTDGYLIDLNGGSVSSQITLSIAGSEKVRLDSSGRLLIGLTSANTSGAELQLKSGVTFPATQIASADANTLDDYEEGSFLPAFGGSTTNGTYTYTTQIGRYIKIGRLVFVKGRLRISGITSAATGTNLRIINLPFNTEASTIESSATISFFSGLVNNVVGLSGIVNVNNNVINIFKLSAAANGVSAAVPADIQVNTDIIFSATYTAVN